MSTRIVVSGWNEWKNGNEWVTRALNADSNFPNWKKTHPRLERISLISLKQTMGEWNDLKEARTCSSFSGPHRTVAAGRLRCGRHGSHHVPPQTPETLLTHTRGWKNTAKRREKLERAVGLFRNDTPFRCCPSRHVAVVSKASAFSSKWNHFLGGPAFCYFDSIFKWIRSFSLSSVSIFF